MEGDGDGAAAAAADGDSQHVAKGNSLQLAASAHARGEPRNLDTHLHNSRG